MLNVNEITEGQATDIVDWHKGIGFAENDPPFNFIKENNYWNYQLWHEEDIVRRSDIVPSKMVVAKRNIDHYNQQRNNAMEKIDEWIENCLIPKTQPVSDKMHSETPGMMIDRLSIMSLKKYHMAEEAVRQSATGEHRQKCKEQVSLLDIQMQDLSKCLTDVLIQLEKGELQFRVYRQLKMYNDPALNPQLYEPSDHTQHIQGRDLLVSSSFIWAPLGYAFIGLLMYVFMALPVWKNLMHPEIPALVAGAGVILVLEYGISLQARQRGFEPLWWLLTGGLPGLMLMLVPAPANEIGLSRESYNQRRKNANLFGFITSMIMMIIWFSVLF